MGYQTRQDAERPSPSQMFEDSTPPITEGQVVREEGEPMCDRF
jgi:hypothetical protein